MYSFFHIFLLIGLLQVHTLILINMGAIQALTSPTQGFGDLATDLVIHIIDSMRPYNLSSLFLGGALGERFIVWDDGEADKLQEERTAWEALEVCIL
jgi:cell division control protein 45